MIVLDLSFHMDLSLPGKADEWHKIKILRDTACSQSLILSSVLPLSRKTAARAVVQGIKLGSVQAPLYISHTERRFYNGK